MEFLTKVRKFVEKHAIGVAASIVSVATALAAVAAYMTDVVERFSK